MIPDISDPRWKRALTTESDYSAAALATRLLVARLRREVAADPRSLSAKVAELRGFFEKNSFVQPDVARL